MFWGTVFLLISNIYVKGLGFCYRVFLMRVFGAEGMGLIEMAMPIFTFMLVISGWGVSLGLSKKLAESGGCAQKGASLLKNALFLLVLFGLVVSCAALLFSPFIAKHLAPDERILPYLRVLIPAVLIIAVASPFRGFFQGLQQVGNLGAAQAIEQSARFCCGIYLAYKMASLAIEQTVTAAALASVAGEAAGLIFLLAAFTHYRRKQPVLKAVYSTKVCGELLAFGTPVTINRLVSSGILMAQALLIPHCLQNAGLNVVAATEAYGRLSGVALTLLNLPGVFTSALACALLPVVAESYLDKKRLAARLIPSLQALVICTLPGMAVLFLFAEPLCDGLFHCPLAAEPLRILAVCGIFEFFSGLLSTVLQGMGQLKALLINNIISGVCLLTAIVILCSRPAAGLAGAAISLNIYFIIAFILNCLTFQNKSGLHLPYLKLFFKPLSSVFLALIPFYLIKNIIFLQEKMAETAILACLYLILYFLILLSLGGLPKFWKRA
ncbi:MAG: oligosaccharide flippase family protein [Clostridia bacterium]|nr:oligosaccharide flippase family protein [Clostridia bacterium]